MLNKKDVKKKNVSEATAQKKDDDIGGLRPFSKPAMTVSDKQKEDNQEPNTSVKTAFNDTSTAYQEFLKHEYDNIAHAHFNTVTTISTFFRQYLLIVSIPLSILTLLMRADSNSRTLEPFLTMFFVVAAFVGLFVLGYVINLRMDVLLYARTVNGIRSFFLQRSDLSFSEEMRYRVLPRNIYIPHYCETRYFVYVVLTFALLDTTYLIMPFVLFSENRSILDGFGQLFSVGLGSFVCISVGLLSLLIHFGLYLSLITHRDKEYLRSHIIGVDIDGVISEHRPLFCKMLKTNCGKDLEPDKITVIPVHEIPGTTITQADEHAVFNDVQYWTDLEITEGTASILKELRNIFGFKIWIFTHRPWPNRSTFECAKKRELENKWKAKQSCCQAAKYYYSFFLYRFPRISESKVIHFFRRIGLIYDDAGTIKRITKLWLRRHQIPYHKLIVEHGNVDTTEPTIMTRNRFNLSKKKTIRIFVEDDLAKAIKLASICEVVFLIRHPYNTPNGKDSSTLDIEIPKNVIIVNSWKEIKNYIRSYL